MSKRTNDRTDDERRDRVPWVGSALIHGLAFVLMVWASAVETELPPMQTIQVDIVSAPPEADEPAEETPPQEELVVDQPEPTVDEPETVVEEEPPPPEVQTPPPETRPDPPPPDPPEDPPATAADTARPDLPTGEDIQVRFEGMKRLYPEYYANIVLQIERCFRWTGAENLEAQIYFVIDADGTVSDDRVQTTSGNIRFDLAALGAVADCAGRGRFGALPEDLPYDRLPVLMNFRPRR